MSAPKTTQPPNQRRIKIVGMPTTAVSTRSSKERLHWRLAAASGGGFTTGGGGADCCIAFSFACRRWLGRKASSECQRLTALALPAVLQLAQPCQSGVDVD